MRERFAKTLEDEDMPPGVRLDDILEEVESTAAMKHHGTAGEVIFPLEDESHGTATWFGLVGPILWALESGSALAIDELDEGLHPLLTREIVRLFHDPDVNPFGAQLLFTTHDATLLSGFDHNPVLRRDEIWFTEKDEAGSTTLYPLSDFRVRKEANHEYLQGRFGAVPVVDMTATMSSVSAPSD
jgi:uncharacterized protein